METIIELFSYERLSVSTEVVDCCTSCFTVVLLKPVVLILMMFLIMFDSSLHSSSLFWLFPNKSIINFLFLKEIWSSIIKFDFLMIIKTVKSNI